MSKSLVEITYDYFRILDRIYEYESKGEPIPQELELAMSELLTSQAEKIDSCASFIGWMNSQKEWLRNEKKRLDEQIKKYEYMEGRIKRAATHVMEIEGKDRLEGLKGHMFSKRKSISAEILSVADLPEEFKSWEPKIDKLKLLKDLRGGKEVPGATLKTSECVIVK